MNEDVAARALRIRRVVARIPKGRVATYGQVAEMADLPRRARLVGRVLSQLPPGSPLPWHRVVDARGKISLRSTELGDGAGRQRRLLEAEGVGFRPSGRIDLRRFGV